MTKYQFPPNGSIVEVDSSNIDTMCYLDGKLIVRFQTGAVYRYRNLSPGTWDAVRNGMVSKAGKENSIGSAFYQLVSSRPDLHPYEKYPWEDNDAAG
jgi:hypothetical protein